MTETETKTDATTKWKALRLAMMAMSMAIIISSVPAMAQNSSAGQTWQGHISFADSNDVLQYRSGALYLSSAAADHAPDWIYLGSTDGYTIGAPGLYVGRLDGTARSSIAFFDPSVRTWFWGTIDGTHLTWTPVNVLVNGEPIFQVGDGPTLFPVASPSANIARNAEKTTSAAKLTPPPSGVSIPGRIVDAPNTPKLRPPSGVSIPGGIESTPNTPTPIVTYPLRGDQYTALARSQHVQTNIMLFANGELYGTTRVWEDTLFAGVHAGVIVILYDEYNRPLWKLGQKVVIGVTGRFWGHSDVTANFTDQVPPALLPYVKAFAIVNTWEPNFWEFFNDFKSLIDYAVDLIKKFIPPPKGGTSTQPSTALQIRQQ